MKLKCLFERCLGGGCSSSLLAVSVVYNFSCQSRLDGTLLLVSLTEESLEESGRERGKVKRGHVCFSLTHLKSAGASLSTLRYDPG